MQTVSCSLPGDSGTMVPFMVRRERPKGYVMSVSWYLGRGSVGVG